MAAAPADFLASASLRLRPPPCQADAQRLLQAGVPLRMDSSFYAFHHKFCLVDGRVLLNGSFNWTAQAAAGNQENLVIFRNEADLAASFAAQFERVWNAFHPPPNGT